MITIRYSPRMLYILVVSLILFPVTAALGQKKTHTVFFEGRENELHVYRINGEEPGKTLLIIGGIQGDEPGGFLAADLYADFSLRRGNLIVVPRANFPSILKQERQINQDMNRKFTDDHASNYEAEVVDVLKRLICESDCFLNLHEGSGIYSPKWEGPMRNPKRYGQSIIADASILKTDKTGQPVNLEQMALAVVEKINRQIKKQVYRFHFNNHRTDDTDSLHKEQRASATYYATQTCKIPAFGIESSKSLPLEQKIRQHIWAINGFMELLDIQPETPGVNLKQPDLEFMIISVNDSVPIVVGKMQRLSINRGDEIRVHDIVTNYDRGLSVDVIGVGNEFNDMKRTLKIMEPTRIVAKKDFYACGSVFIDLDDKGVKAAPPLKVTRARQSNELKYKFKINGKTVIVENYGRVNLQRGDRLMIEDVISGPADPSEYIVNFKGFVGNRSNNTGEDRGYVIDTSKDILMAKYSINKKGLRYYVLITLGGKEVGKVFVEFQS
ncbi:MAG: hypothetical protein D3926_21340 [Desulfobacteraceae bacterium]|nr:MAG: hypothetical protein D3926_21340 [Desulfobacteraceae bacterium]